MTKIILILLLGVFSPTLCQNYYPTAAKAHGIAQYAPYQHQQQHQQQSACPPQSFISSYGSATSGCDAFSSSSSDFNPLLSGGVRGLPGIKAKINSRGFQYFSSILAPILDQEIKKARIPPISQSLPAGIPGCIQVFNLYVSRYRCPQRVAVYPACPNRIIIAVQNLDIGLTGNLGGEINILIPIKLFGIIQINAHQVSIYAQLVIARGPTGAPYVQVAGCSASVGYLDVYVQNGGLIGDIANSGFLRPTIIQEVRKMLPTQICSQLPNIVNEKINGQLGNLPQSIPLTKLLEFAGGALGLGGAGGGGGGGCGAPRSIAPPCHAAQKTPTVSKPLQLPTSSDASSDKHVVFASSTSHTGSTNSTSSTPKPLPATLAPSKVSAKVSSSVSKNAAKKSNKQLLTILGDVEIVTTATVAATTTPSIAIIHKFKGIPHAESPYASEGNATRHRVIRSVVIPPRAHPPPSPSASAVFPTISSGVSHNKTQLSKHASSVVAGVSKIPATTSKPKAPLPRAFIVASETQPKSLALPKAAGVPTSQGFPSASGFPQQSAPAASSGGGGGIQFIGPGEPSPCGGCPGVNERQDPLSLIQDITKYLDLSKLNDIYLRIQLGQTYATFNDYTIELSGEFNYGGQACSPFSPFPMDFPCCSGGKMAEALISDFTLNTLFYSLHKKGFLSARLGPETPKIGPLLKTTCAHDDDVQDDGAGIDAEFNDGIGGASSASSQGGGASSASSQGGNSQSYKTIQKLHRHVRSAVAAGTSTYTGAQQQPQQPFQQQPQPQPQQQSFNPGFGGASGGGLGGTPDLGSFEICLGDLFPTIGQRFPNRNIFIQLHTSRAPSIIFSERNGGSATIDLIADADLYTDANEKIGTIRIEGAIEAQIHTSGNRLTGSAQITHLQITNPDQSLGIQQQTLDTFTVLGRELIGNGLNQFLQRGIPLEFGSGGAGGLPLNFISPEIRIVEHGIYLQSDFTISPSFITQLSGGGGGGGGQGGACRR